MAAVPINPSIAHLSTDVAGKSTVQPASKVSFGNVFSGVVNDANQQQIAADQAIQQLATGETGSVQDVVVSMAKADLSFRFVLEMRNRVIESYQELMRMQI